MHFLRLNSIENDFITDEVFKSSWHALFILKEKTGDKFLSNLYFAWPFSWRNSWRHVQRYFAIYTLCFSNQILTHDNTVNLIHGLLNFYGLIADHKVACWQPIIIQHLRSLPLIAQSAVEKTATLWSVINPE